MGEQIHTMNLSMLELEREVERLRAAGDKMAEAVRARWTGPDRCDCECCTAARGWNEARI